MFDASDTRTPPPLLRAPPRPRPFSSDRRRRAEEDDEDSKPSDRLSEATTQRLSRLGALGTGLLFLGGKSKYLFTALKLGKMTSLASLFASTAAYSMFFGPAFGVGIVGQILIHESGHALAMRALGIPHGPMVFVPFMGAAVEMKKHPHSAKDEAIVAYAGPLAGTAAALGIAGYGVVSGSQLAIALADVGFMLNLFNLLPIGQMDGGRIAGALSKHFLLGGLVTGCGIAYAGLVHNPIFYLILMMAGFGTYERYFGAPPSKYYFQLTSAARASIGLAYMALVAFLIGLMSWNNKRRMSPAQIRQLKGIEASESADVLVSWSESLADDEYLGKKDSDPYVSSQSEWKRVDKDPWATR